MWHPTFQASDSRSVLNVGVPRRPTRFCDVFLRCSASMKCKHNYDYHNNNKFIVVFVVIILIIAIIDLLITTSQRTSYISEVWGFQSGIAEDPGVL
jgi:hypothetical protein